MCVCVCLRVRVRARVNGRLPQWQWHKRPDHAGPTVQHPWRAAACGCATQGHSEGEAALSASGEGAKGEETSLAQGRFLFLSGLGSTLAS